MNEIKKGEQPLHTLMIRLNLKNSNLVERSTDQLTYKMVAKGRKGRQLTLNAQQKILKALNKDQEEKFTLGDLFNYPGKE